MQNLKVAFESDIHGTGMTFDMSDVDDRARPIEFEAIEQGVKAKSFSEVPKHMKQCWKPETLDQKVERRR
jgi:hypothetical protein